MVIIEKIKEEWNKPIGLPTPYKYTLLSEFDQNKMKNIFIEEVRETLTAISDDNVKEQLDGMADMLYVLYNWGIQLGIGECFEVRNDLNIKYGSLNSLQCIIKIQDLLEYNINDEEEAIQSFREINNIINWLSHSLLNITKGHNNPQLVLYEALNEVHRSNLTKKDKETGEFILNSSKKVVKSKYYEPPNINKILDKYGIRYGDTGNSII